MIKDLIAKNRSYRRFYQDVPVSIEVLKDLIELARLSPSAANRQPLKYILSNKLETNLKIFSCLSWAGYLTDWPGPEEGERPSAYIIMLGDSRITNNYFCDYGIAAQSILLGAVEKGLGGCIFGSVNREKLREKLKIPSYYDVLQVIAIGKPKETVVIETALNGEIKYWRDENGVHHVPKRPLDELIVSLNDFSKG
ncbi:MAG: nitroreductase family protein [Firmicutes bacterium]|nr:nitroreductase family protein [Bacillota bacterium]